MNLNRASSLAGLSGYISRAFRQRFDLPLTSSFCSSGYPRPKTTVSDSPESYGSNISSAGNIEFSNLGKLSEKLASLKVKENLSLPSALSSQSSIRSNDTKMAETGSTSRPMDFVRGIIGESGNGGFGGSQYPQHTVEQNADIVHIKLLRNNTFITLTDSKGNRKPGERVSASAGSLPDKGGKVSRYGAEATAEHVGREARKSGVKSVVMKVNGFTHFKKKRQAIMAFREGYTLGRGDQTPIVYIEDTTRRPHNGCRLPKKRRI